MRGTVVFFIVLLALSIPVSAREGKMKLLAIRQAEDGAAGQAADLSLEIKPGSGRVFLDTFPLTQEDTQISIRFAKQVACDFLSVNCGKVDFFYTIRAESPIIAGPSAGAAIALLTLSVLEEKKIDPLMSITGTINSGGIIGPVGGLKEKIDAAKSAGLTQVLIPAGERFSDEGPGKGEKASVPPKKESNNETNNTPMINMTNKTIDLFAYGAEIGVAVVEVSDIREALSIFRNEPLPGQNESIAVDEKYRETMRLLAESLCNRTSTLVGLASGRNLSSENETFHALSNYSTRAQKAMADGQYYTAASYCFTGNVRGSFLFSQWKNHTEKTFSQDISLLEKKVKQLDTLLRSRSKATITDLESFIVVVERLNEAVANREEIKDSSPTRDNLFKLSYAIERVNSAIAWFKFFDHRGNPLRIDQKALKDSCETKLAEAEERAQYVLLFFPNLPLSQTRKEIELAHKDREEGQYELCLFKATQAKAESNSILGVSGVEESKVKDVVNKKLEIAKEVILSQVKRGNFPILGYSYFEYATNLKNEDLYSALLFAEYALEVSNLDMYFKPNHTVSFTQLPVVTLGMLIIGIIIGFSVGAFVFGFKKRRITDGHRSKK
ncbi:hypothetical protein HYV84_08410 [Candidatus Woesearchaeota archaeon]|nr:hypothetical protein [Candidatus Woesearchaeota archaeon]